ncbi:MAG: hypothetical protein CMN32_12240 [Saprospirales bacterium]|jgi:hypothetical protein|nr:hypothetical protein [Saprospirales bacterium]
MSFIPKQHSDALKAGGSRNDYLSPSKVKADGQVRFAILANEPLCYFEVWGEDETGKGKPFRFAEEATADDIEQEMGANYTRRCKDDGTEEPQKFALAMPIYNFDVKRIQVLSMTQKGLQKELDEISQVEEYGDMTEWDFIMTKAATVSPDMYGLRPVPRKKDSQAAIDAAWNEAVTNGFDITRLLTGGHPFKAD